MQVHQVSLSINKPVDWDAVRYVLKAGDEVELPEMHCRRCHYTSKLRVKIAPNQCSNVQGYVDSKGNKYPPCRSRAWDRWPSEFDPTTCKCIECLIIWHLEQQQGVNNKSEAEKLMTVDTVPARRRGRPLKYKKP